MKKVTSKCHLVYLSIAGMVSSLLPWSGVYMGSLPYGDTPDTIFLGIQKNGLICAICLGLVLLICLATSLNKAMNQKVLFANLFLSILSLAVSVFDIFDIAVTSQGMVGTVPFLREGPFVMTLITLWMIVINLNTLRQQA